MRQFGEIIFLIMLFKTRPTEWGTKQWGCHCSTCLSFCMSPNSVYTQTMISQLEPRST